MMKPLDNGFIFGSISMDQLFVSGWLGQAGAAPFVATCSSGRRDRIPRGSDQ
jgi:hypothetical protein